ncbi:alpha/beta fold hydrolase [Nonomuraea sp. NPDC050663]|uniref:alpha/beta fold hydrolase n=1 Tax=Nonomuraea sp. NPDC050663 TaxID=3364370 RepID=UPI0037B68AA3
MRRRRVLGAGIGAMVGGSMLFASSAAVADAPDDDVLARSLSGGFRSMYATANGVRLHYVAGGQGAPVILLPGWPRTWWEFHKIMPDLARNHRVIAVDLRGMGASAKPKSGYDKRTMAADIAALITELGFDQADVIGSDIGSMVAFSLAANHPERVRKVVMIDVAHPDEGLNQLTLLPQPDVFHLWWFAFNQVHGLPEQLLAGRARALIDHLCDLILLDKNAVSDQDRRIYAHAYNTRNAIRASNGWYQTYGQDIADDRTYKPVTPPVLALASPSNDAYMRALLPAKAARAEIVRVENTSHYVVEERPQVVLGYLSRFLS